MRLRPPSAAAVRRLTYAVILAAALVAAWNVVRYPPGLGYDAIDQVFYTDGIRHGEGLPDRRGAYYTPPGFYAVAAVATEVGEALGLEEPLRVTQAVNAALAIGTLLLLLLLVREVWPGREVLHLLAVAFAATTTILLRSAAMFHPETMSLFFATLALLLAARMLAREDYRVRTAVAVGLALGAGQLVRAWALWTFAVVLLALAAVWLVRRAARRRVALAAAVVVAATAVVAGPWYGYQATRYTNPIFDQPQVAKPLWERRAAAFYVDPGLPELVTQPYRPSFTNRFWPTVYAEAWGDYFGVFAWQAHKGEPDAGTRRDLTLQMLALAVPTMLALAGWLWLMGRALRRRLPDAQLLVALMPLAGLTGLLYFTVSYPTPDGDVIKATYMLTTLPAWAACFAVAGERLLRTRLALPLALLLAVAAVVSLRFALYGAPLGGLL
ncbi:MAG TPA: hypothetical protein VM204_06805 [Gaiellaceae bacterium]|nr:hypothetical protein [Gaiellaceae bacterium]